MKIRKILISQPKPNSEKSPYFDLSEKYGVEIVFRPLIKIAGLSSRAFRKTRVPINEHTAVILTTRTAVDHYFRLCKELRFNVPDTMKYFCVGETVANYLQRYITYRKRKIFFGPTGRIEDLMPLINKHNKESYLYPISSANDTELPVDRHKIYYMPAVMYCTVSDILGPDEPFDYDLIAVFTPAGVRSIKENFPGFKQGETAIAAMGSKTLVELEKMGFRLDVTTGPKAPSMAMAIDKFLAEHANDTELIKHQSREELLTLPEGETRVCTAINEDEPIPVPIPMPEAIVKPVPRRKVIRRKPVITERAAAAARRAAEKKAAAEKKK